MFTICKDITEITKHPNWERGTGSAFPGRRSCTKTGCGRQISSTFKPVSRGD